MGPLILKAGSPELARLNESYTLPRVCYQCAEVKEPTEFAMSADGISRVTTCRKCSSLNCRAYHYEKQGWQNQTAKEEFVDAYKSMKGKLPAVARRLLKI